MKKAVQFLALKIIIVVEVKKYLVMEVEVLFSLSRFFIFSILIVHTGEICPDAGMARPKNVCPPGHYLSLIHI